MFWSHQDLTAPIRKSGCLVVASTSWLTGKEDPISEGPRDDLVKPSKWTVAVEISRTTVFVQSDLLLPRTKLRSDLLLQNRPVATP